MNKSFFSKIKSYIKLIRPHHCIKNFLVFLPVMFSGDLLKDGNLFRCIIGFAAFSLLSFSVYVLNDIKDVENDKRHSVKRNRPIACGAVSIPEAVVIAVLLIVASAAVAAFFLTDIALKGFLVLGAYVIINAVYSFGGKKLPVLDVTLLSLGFIIRMVYGSVVTGTPISEWLFLTVLSMSYFLGLGKRRGESMRQAYGTREVLRFYNKNFFDKFMYVFMGLSIAFYSLWAVSVSQEGQKGMSLFIWTVPVVIVICMKYSLDIESGGDGDPVEVVFSDKILIALICLYALSALGIIYLPGYLHI